MERVRIISVWSQSHWGYFAPNETQSGSLLSQNSQITVNEIWEENLRTVNEIYLSTVSQGVYTFTQSQSEDLYEIAIQCPLAGGKAVFLARGLYGLIEPLRVNDIDVCFEEGYNLRQGNTLTNSNAQNNTSNYYTLYPNPCSNEVILSLHSCNKNARQIKVYNLFGQLISEWVLKQETEKEILDVTNLKEGVYSLILTDDNKNIIYSQKLVIIK